MTLVERESQPRPDPFNHVVCRMSCGLNLIPERVRVFLEDHLKNLDFLLRNFQLFEEFLSDIKAPVGCGLTQDVAAYILEEVQIIFGEAVSFTQLLKLFYADKGV